MRSILALIVLSHFASPAFAQDPRAAVWAHMECVRDNAAKLDDRQMEVARLSQLVMPRCHVAHEKAMQATMPVEWKKTSKDRAKELEFDHTRAAVLLYRSRQSR